MKKLLIPIIVGILLVLAGTVYISGRIIEANKVRPDIFAKPKSGKIIKARKNEPARITLLNHAFWTLNKEFDFIPEHLAVLERIVDGYRQAGDEKRHRKLSRLYEDYKLDTIASEVPETPAVVEYDPQVWIRAREWVRSGEYEKAARNAGGDPYVLDMVAEQRPDLTAGMADFVDKRSPDFVRYYTAVAVAYIQAGELKAAEEILMDYLRSPFPGVVTVPLVESFLSQDRYIDAIDLACQTAEFPARAAAFVIIANGLPDDYGVLDQATRSRVEASLD